VLKADMEAGEMLQERAGNMNGAKKREMGANVPSSLPPMTIHMHAAQDKCVSTKLEAQASGAGWQ